MRFSREDNIAALLRVNTSLAYAAAFTDYLEALTNIPRDRRTPDDFAVLMGRKPSSGKEWIIKNRHFFLPPTLPPPQQQRDKT